jgi:hypothetical protein
MADDAQVCPQCATPVANAPQPTPPPPAPSQQPQASTSPWLNPAPQGQYPGQGQYPPAQYPPGYFPPPQQAPTDGKATASLVFGILSLIPCFLILAGIPAIILGHLSRSEIKRSMGRLGGAGMALAGLIMGYISIGFSLLIIPAIVLPNMVGIKIGANESVAAGTVRRINTSQVTYSTEYPTRGYAPNLATLGPGPSGSCSTGTEEHACLIDNAIGNTSCTAGAWCTKNGYKFSMSGETNCPDQTTQGADSSVGCNYVIVATPVSGATGRRSFCSTADAIVRYRYTSSLYQPISVEECSRWNPIF